MPFCKITMNIVTQGSGKTILQTEPSHSRLATPQNTQKGLIRDFAASNPGSLYDLTHLSLSVHTESIHLNNFYCESVMMGKKNHTIIPIISEIKCSI